MSTVYYYCILHTVMPPLTVAARLAPAPSYVSMVPSCPSKYRAMFSWPVYFTVVNTVVNIRDTRLASAPEPYVSLT